MNTSRLIPSWFFGLLLLISAIPPASAREKSDVVFLKNGDRITCEIKSLERGMLTVKTDSMSTVQIRWQDVDVIKSKFVFTVQDTQGQIFIGSLQAAADERHVNVEGPQPASNLEQMAIVKIEELGASRWRRLSGAVDLGYSYTKASNITQFNFSGDLAYRTERWESQLNYSSTISTSDGESDANRNVLTLSGTRYFSGQWLAYSQVGFEHNLELQLEKRVSFLGGPGYRIKQSNRSLVTVVGAASFTKENYYGQEATKNAEGFFGIDAQFFKLYSPKVDITNQFAFKPNFTTRGRRRLEFNSKLRIEVLKDFFVNLTFYDSYDSKPPSETATKNDYGFTTGLSWSFRR
jgi:hypothetical protein